VFARENIVAAMNQYNAAPSAAETEEDQA